MKAWVVARPGPINGGPLDYVDRGEPHAAAGQIRVRVLVCGVCRTDLHLAEGDLPPKHSGGVVPGHEVVGMVDEVSEGVTGFAVGDRAGIAWLRHTCGRCRFCVRGDENLCIAPAFTGWDDDGGYAEYAVVDAAYAYKLPPSELTDEQTAPLLCAGIIGFRSLRQSDLPQGGRLGIYGFGASAHLTAQVAMAEGGTVHVMTRSKEAQELALDLGVASAGDAYDAPPEPLDSAIVFAPVGDIVIPAMEALDRGGTCAIAGIYMSDIPSLNYERHLFQEKKLRSVTANTRADGREFMEIAARIKIKVQTSGYPMDKADEALRDLAADRVTGAAVIRISA